VIDRKVMIWGGIDETGAIRGRYVVGMRLSPHYQPAISSVRDDIAAAKAVSAHPQMQMILVPLLLLQAQSVEQVAAAIREIDELLMEYPPMSAALPDLDSPLI